MARPGKKELNYDPLEDTPDYRCTGNVLGSGAFGLVVEAWVRSSTFDPPLGFNGKDKCAIKLLRRGSSITREVETEVLEHSRMRHPNIVQMSRLFVTRRHLGIVLELVEGGTLFDYVKRRRGCLEDQARRIFQQLILGVHYIHSLEICQRDLKLDNILVDDARTLKPLIKITDFGYCKSAKQSPPDSGVGTYAYMAPEVFENMGKLIGGKYDGYKADMWSCGVVLFVMLFYKYPFDDESEKASPRSRRARAEFLDRLKLGAAGLQLPQQPEVSSPCTDLINKLLDPNPITRPDAAVVLQHPWVTKEMPANAMQQNAECIQHSLEQRDALGQRALRMKTLLDNAKQNWQ